MLMFSWILNSDYFSEAMVSLQEGVEEIIDNDGIELVILSNMEEQVNDHCTRNRDNHLKDLKMIFL